jgi:hypothetical protein
MLPTEEVATAFVPRYVVATRGTTLAAAAHAPSVRMAHRGADEPWLARALATAGFRAEAGLPNMSLDVA